MISAAIPQIPFFHTYITEFIGLPYDNLKTIQAGTFQLLKIKSHKKKEKEIKITSMDSKKNGHSQPAL